MRVIALTSLAASLTAVEAAACPLCVSETGKRVREGIFNAEFGYHLAATMAPFAICLLLIALLHFVLGRAVPRLYLAGDRAGNRAALECRPQPRSAPVDADHARLHGRRLGSFQSGGRSHQPSHSAHSPCHRRPRPPAVGHCVSGLRRRDDRHRLGSDRAQSGRRTSDLRQRDVSSNKMTSLLHHFLFSRQTSDSILLPATIHRASLWTNRLAACRGFQGVLGSSSHFSRRLSTRHRCGRRFWRDSPPSPTSGCPTRRHRGTAADARALGSRVLTGKL